MNHQGVADFRISDLFFLEWIMQNKKIVIIDSNLFSRNITQQMIRSLGYTNDIHFEYDGSQAYYSLQHGLDPAIIIANDNVYPMSGFQLLSAIKRDKSFSRIPYMLVLSEIDKVVISQSKNLGINSIILRPFSTDTLSKHLTNIFAGRNFSKND